MWKHIITEDMKRTEKKENTWSEMEDQLRKGSMGLGNNGIPETSRKKTPKRITRYLESSRC